jgi:transketolase C-terminal domain/subunit
MAWKELLSTDYGLASLGVIVFVIGMSVFFGRMFSKKMNEKPTNE